VTAARTHSFRRRTLLPAILSVVGVTLLMSLGFWQLERKVWKEALIATLQDEMQTAPKAVPSAAEFAALTQAQAEFRRIETDLAFLPDAEPALLYTGASGLRQDVRQPGYFVFAPARLPDGRIVVVNRGYVPLAAKNEIAPPPPAITGYLRWPEKPGLFVSERDVGGIWFVRDPQAMARGLNWGVAAPFYIDQETPVPTTGLPRPGALAVRLRNDHLGYALTWFGLAATLIGVFGMWVIREWYNKAPRQPPLPCESPPEALV
jgi:surfeit locus 1 family protein